MLRHTLIFLTFIFSVLSTAGQVQHVVVADSATHMPLPSASVFDSDGRAIGVCDAKGRMPYISPESYPVTVRYMGYRERIIPRGYTDTVFMREHMMELPEVVVESSQQKVMHVLAYVREYSTLSGHTDTVFLFREKMVDYMLTPDKRTKFKGWSTPRIIKAKSYYRFTDSYGLDSVSNKFGRHFSWSDWPGIAVPPSMPKRLRGIENGSDTIHGKYSPTQIWSRNRDRVNVDVNVLADTISRVWVPNLADFFRKDMDFENFRVKFSYDNIVGDTISPMDLTGYSFHIESNGRGHDMFGFDRVDETVYVTTYAEVYILDKEYITVKEAKKWAKHRFDTGNIEIYEPSEAPELQQSVKELIARVDGIDHGLVRQDLVFDRRLAGGDKDNRNFQFGHRVLSMLKQLTGITLYKSHKNFNDNWDDFKKQRRNTDKKRSTEE